jgi:hypothetical protein
LATLNFTCPGHPTTCGLPVDVSIHFTGNFARASLPGFPLGLSLRVFAFFSFVPSEHEAGHTLSDIDLINRCDVTCFSMFPVCRRDGHLYRQPAESGRALAADFPSPVIHPSLAGSAVDPFSEGPLNGFLQLASCSGYRLPL